MKFHAMNVFSKIKSALRQPQTGQDFDLEKKVQRGLDKTVHEYRETFEKLEEYDKAKQ